MASDLFKPSLTGEALRRAKSYDIGKLFWVAFFGGLAPLLVLGTINAKWLKVERKFINLLVGLGAAVMVAKIIANGLVIGDFTNVKTVFDVLSQDDGRTVRSFSRVANVLLFLGFYGVMKPKYQKLLITGGGPEPLLKDAVKWIAIAGTVEAVLLIGGGILVSYVV